MFAAFARPRLARFGSCGSGSGKGAEGLGLFSDGYHGLRASHSPDEAEQVQVGSSHRIYLGPRQEAIVEKVSGAGQDAVESIEVTEASEHLLNHWFVF